MHGAGAWDPDSEGGQAPSPGKDSALGETELDLSGAPRPHFQFINPEGVPLRKSWAWPHLLPEKVRSPQDTGHTHCP